MTIKSIKQEARGALLGHWREHIPVSLLLIALELLAMGIVDLFPSSGGATVYLYSIAVAAILQVLLGLFYAGGSWHFLKILRGQESPVQDVFVPLKKSPDRYLIVGIIELAAGAVVYLPLFLNALFGFLTGTPGLLFDLIWLVIGTVLYVFVRAAFAMSRYLLLDEDALGAVDSLKRSVTMMREQKKKLVLLVLSFAGYLALAICTVGLGLIWVLPYFLTSLAEFYEQLRR